MSRSGLKTVNWVNYLFVAPIYSWTLDGLLWRHKLLHPWRDLFKILASRRSLTSTLYVLGLIWKTRDQAKIKTFFPYLFNHKVLRDPDNQPSWFRNHLDNLSLLLFDLKETSLNMCPWKHPDQCCCKSQTNIINQQYTIEIKITKKKKIN